MKRIPITICIALCLALPLSAEHHETAAGGLSGTERGQLIDLLERSRTELEELVDDVTGDRWSRKPAEDRWSVGEVVEHLALAEEGMYAMASGALAQGEDPDWKAVLQAMTVDSVLSSMQDRAQKFQAPPQFVPQGTMNREEVLAKFAIARARMLDFARSTEAPVKRHTGQGPAGKMNVHLMVALCAGHNLRHNQQIVEVVEQLAKSDTQH